MKKKIKKLKATIKLKVKTLLTKNIKRLKDSMVLQALAKIKLIKFMMKFKETTPFLVRIRLNNSKMFYFLILIRTLVDIFTKEIVIILTKRITSKLISYLGCSKR